MSVPETAEPAGRDRPVPEGGPGGYLPERAARRARKIVLRGQMSAGWPLAALVAAVVLVAAGGVFLITRAGAPGAPFEAVAEVAELTPGSAAEVETAAAGRVLLVHTGGALRALEAPADAVELCLESGNLEGADGSLWRTDGRSLTSTTGSLAAYPLQVHRGTVYVDATATRQPAAPASTEATPACD